MDEENEFNIHEDTTGVGYVSRMELKELKPLIVERPDWYSEDAFWRWYQTLSDEAKVEQVTTLDSYRYIEADYE